MEYIAIFIAMVVCFVIIGIACEAAENKRSKEGKPSRDTGSRILILKSINRRK